MKIAVIVPAYNEEKAISGVVNDLNEMALHNNLELDVVVVNDCSKDSTLNVINGLKCIVLDLPINLGIGGAVQTGFKFAFENGYDFAIQADGDGQHPAIEIPKLIKAAKEQNADVVIGSRFIEKDGFQSSFMRRFGINFFKAFNKMLAGVTINDSTSGFRLISKKVLAVVAEYYPDEYPEPEAIILYSLNGFRIVEVPVIMKERQGGVSSIGAVSSVYYMLKVSLAILYTYIRIRFTKKNIR
jgi:glycosyltransferase involved in cell wall biosynthesis